MERTLVAVAAKKRGLVKVATDFLWNQTMPFFVNTSTIVDVRRNLRFLFLFGDFAANSCVGQNTKNMES